MESMLTKEDFQRIMDALRNAYKELDHEQVHEDKLLHLKEAEQNVRSAMGFNMYKRTLL